MPSAANNTGGGGGTCCHVGSPLWYEASGAELVGARVVGLVMFVMLGLASVVVPCVYMLQRARKRGTGAGFVPPAPPIVAQALATLTLACAWLFMGTNAWLWRGGSIERVLFNAWLWDWVLCSLGEFYEIQKPLRNRYYPWLRRGPLAVLVLAAWLGADARRFVSLVAVLPLSALVLYVATLASPNPRRAAWSRVQTSAHYGPEHSWQLSDRPGLVMLGCLACVGAWCIITEPLTPEYGGPLPLWLTYIFMAMAHMALVMYGFVLAHLHVSMDRLSNSVAQFGAQENVMADTVPNGGDDDGGGGMVSALASDVDRYDADGDGATTSTTAGGAGVIRISDQSTSLSLLDK